MTDSFATPALPDSAQIQSLFFDAVRIGDDQAVGALLRAGADIEGADARGYTALVLSSYNGHLSTTALLLDAGARPEGATDAQGNSALMGVAFKGYPDIARLLIDRGADVNYQNRAGQTAAMMATLFNQAAILDLLIERGADLGIADAGGNTAQRLALMQGNAALAARLS